MAQRDYYEILGLSRGASEADLKKAYRRMAMKHHPDRASGDDKKNAEHKFKEINEAYQILSDPEKRQIYDQYGHAGVNPSAGGGGAHAHGGFSGFSGFGSFEDLFGDILNGHHEGRHQQGMEGADLRYPLELTLEEAASGTTKVIHFPRLGRCGECQGTGAAKGTKPVNCEDCGGAGQIRIQQGFFSVQQTCPRCHGSGKIIKTPCGKCHGQARIQEQKTVSVKIPAGVDAGDRIRLSGEGEAGMLGGAAGDLYVQVALKPHAIFKRDGGDLYCEVPISFVTATLGGELDVPTLKGKIKLKIPAETQTNKLFRIRGKGIKPVRGHQVGDLLCRIHIETPVNLNREQKEVLQKFDDVIKSDNKNHSPQQRSWFDRVKHFFEEMKL
jgi:molecular chaperone DnaJ